MKTQYKDQFEDIKTQREMIKFLESQGYTIPKNGNHLVCKCPGKPSVSLPNHKELAPGTKRNILKLIFGG